MNSQHDDTPFDFANRHLIGALELTIQDLENIKLRIASCQQSFLKEHQITKEFIGRERLHPRVQSALELTWQYFSYKLRNYPTAEIDEKIIEHKGAIKKWKDLGGKLTLQHIKLSKDLVFRSVECVCGDNQKKEVDSYIKYLQEFDRELASMIHERKQSAKELSDKFIEQERNERKLLESFDKQLDDALGQFRKIDLPKMLAQP